MLGKSTSHINPGHGTEAKRCRSDADIVTTMRRGISLIVAVGLLGAACSDHRAEVGLAPDLSVSHSAETAVVESAHASRDAVSEPSTPKVWEGYASTASADGLAAITFSDLDVHDEPGSPSPTRSVDATTILGTPTVLAVVEGPRDGWARVMIPGRPNGSTGWIAASDVEFFVVDSRIVVDLSERLLWFEVDGQRTLTTEVGIGSVHNPTPTGLYFVTDNVSLADPDGPWGPHALGISARSEVITEFNGGDGIIGIHGTNNPSSIGGNISLGCVRLPNEAITALHQRVPLGTIVEIRA